MKPIVPKKITPPSVLAESLETSFQKTFASSSTKDETITTESQEIPKDKTVKTERKPKIEAENTEGVLPTKKKTKKAIVAVKREGVNRITLDIPNDVFSQMETHKEATGQTMKFLMVSLLKKFFTENLQTK